MCRLPDDFFGEGLESRVYDCLDEDRVEWCFSLSSVLLEGMLITSISFLPLFSALSFSTTALVISEIEGGCILRSPAFVSEGKGTGTSDNSMLSFVTSSELMDITASSTTAFWSVSELTATAGVVITALAKRELLVSESFKVEEKMFCAHLSVIDGTAVKESMETEATVFVELGGSGTDFTPPTGSGGVGMFASNAAELILAN